MAAECHRVLMVADSVGGVWQYALELARGLLEQGDEVALATMGSELTAEQRRSAASIAGLSLHPSRWKLAWMDDPWADVERAGEWLMNVAEQVRPTVVHLNDYSHAGLSWRAPVLMVGHSCVLSWWRGVHDLDAPEPEWQRYRESVGSGLAAADMVVAPSRSMLGRLEHHYGPLRNPRVIYNARTPAATNDLIRREPLILAAGRLWDPAKNIGALSAVAPGLDWPILVAGEHRHPNGHDLDLPDVRLLGPLSSSELAEWMARASIYALPARYEPFGLSALEAAQAGCALVLGDIDSLHEVWGDAALFVDPDDHAALAAVLRRLIADPVLRAGHVARARARAVRYAPDAMVDAYRRAYSELETGPGRRGRSPDEHVTAGAVR
ncbi:MAG: glycosyltransferase family 4 protein [Pseudomonadota bacterium]|nr:glycosyltransferase family 4 protein [Pseudomonadota bacterium]